MLPNIYPPVSTDPFGAVYQLVTESTGADYDAEVTAYSQPYAKKRYQFVLSRVLFCALELTTPQTEEVQRVIFYKDGSVSTEGASDATLLAWGAAGWVGDYNMAFWQIRRAARELSQSNPAYSFCYDAGLRDLLRLC